TVNQYFPSRGPHQIPNIFQFLPLTLPFNLNTLHKHQKTQPYPPHITYSTNNHLPFHYLPHNILLYKHQILQTPLHYPVI
ncbi:preprotein translocase subunit SecA, partial [Bacillus altitudinis]|uniref:preprotein translocase subunit SecA n=1 Tax=Bacillus altitudinis TaxID=293387 RepID=UPI0011A5A6C4